MTSPNGVFTPYSTIAPWLKGRLPGWVPPLDAERIASYQAYDEMYWNHNENYKLVARGTDDVAPIYVPRPKTIVETLNMYIGKGLNFLVDPEIGTPNAQGLTKKVFTQLFARERFLSRYNSNKRFGLVRGDWIWHLMADPTKPAGSRLRVVTVDPGSWFPVFLDDDPDRLHKVHIVDRYINPSDSKAYVKKRTYTKEIGGDGGFTGVITFEEAIYEEEKTFKSDGTPTKVTLAPTALDPRITSIPVFHIPNFDEPGNPYGSSELRGMERLIAAVNQVLSDEDLSLALMGLGVYATDSTAQPRNPQGETVPWTIYPGKVLQGATGLKKVEGITSVTPFGEHYGRLVSELEMATGASMAAMGAMEVQVAESGVALQIRLSPTLAKAEEKDQIIKDLHSHLFHNIQVWHQVYEGEDLSECVVTPTFGDKLPRNKSAEVDLCLRMMSTDPPIMSAKTARQYLTEHAGLSFDEAEEVLVYAERKSITEASAPSATAGTDPFTDRINAELGGADGGAPTDGPNGAAQPDAGATTTTPAPNSANGVPARL